LINVNVGYQEGQADPQEDDAAHRRRRPHRLLGANGNGKSTFAKLLAGRLKAETGGDDATGAEGCDLRPAPARRFAAGRKRLRARAPADAGRAGVEGALPASPSSVFRPRR
jgi:ABC-type branched-subunit amino acid transport system ATPase component